MRTYGESQGSHVAESVARLTRDQTSTDDHEATSVPLSTASRPAKSLSQASRQGRGAEDSLNVVELLAWGVLAFAPVLRKLGERARRERERDNVAVSYVGLAREFA